MSRCLKVTFFDGGKASSIICLDRKVRQDGSVNQVQTNRSVVINEGSSGFHKIAGTDMLVLITGDNMYAKIASAMPVMSSLCQEHDERAVAVVTTQDDLITATAETAQRVLPCMRICDLAKELGTTSKILLEFCNSLNIRVKNSASVLTRGQIDRLRTKFDEQQISVG